MAADEQATNQNLQPPASGGTQSPPKDQSQQSQKPDDGSKPAGSIYKDVGLPDPGEKGSSSWPENWRLDMSGGDEKLAKQLERYQNPGEVSKALLAAQQRIRSGEYRRVTPPPDTKDEAALAAWREEQGLPKTAAEYTFDVVEGFDFAKADPQTKAALGEFQQTFHSANLSKQQADAVVKGITAVSQKQMEEQAKADAEYGDRAEDTLRADWGADYRTNIQANWNFLTQKLGSAEEATAFVEARMPNGRKLGDNPAISKLINEMARMEGSDIIYNGGGDAKGVDARIAEIEKMISNQSADYTNAVAEEYQGLLAKREARQSRQ